MNDYEKRYYDLLNTKGIEPFDCGLSLHMSHSSYRIDDEVVTLYWQVSELEKDRNALPSVEIVTWKAYEQTRKIYGLWQMLIKKLRN